MVLLFLAYLCQLFHGSPEDRFTIKQKIRVEGRIAEKLKHVLGCLAPEDLLGMYKGCKRYLADACQIGIIDPHDGEILRNPDPPREGDLYELVCNLVIIADHPRAAVDPLQQMVGDVGQVHDLRGIKPQNVLLTRLQGRIHQRFQIAPVAQRSLAVVPFEDAGDLCMDGINQQLSRLCRGTDIIDPDTGDIQIRIVCVEEKDGDIPVQDLIVILKIRVGNLSPIPDGASAFSSMVSSALMIIGR